MSEEDYQKIYKQKIKQLQIEQQKKEILKKLLSAEAYERMMNVRLSNPELYEKVVASLAYLSQSGNPMGKISDEQLYQLLSKMSQRRETSIEFRKK
ncbi:MAG: DNA-binding protein [Candidatus Anstonellaceae archaeon]